jgi:hypothetical protein
LNLSRPDSFVGQEALMTQKVFTLFPDWETSEGAGAGDTFQVSSLEDKNGNDRTDLVDQGVHYSAAEEVARDIAAELGMSPDDVLVQIE